MWAVRILSESSVIILPIWENLIVDGVVAYSSAHIDEAVSELVVRSSHSVQGNPQAIEEIRLILLEHATVPGESR